MAELKLEIKSLPIEHLFDVYVNGWVIGYIQYVEMTKKWVPFPNGLGFLEKHPDFKGAREFDTQEEARDKMVALFKQRLKG